MVIRSILIRHFQSREHICKIVSDIVSRYDVDAIHMDDYPILIRSMEWISDDNASFGYGGGFSNKADWRRGNVNILIKKLHETIRGIKPWEVRNQPFGIYRNQKTDPLGSNTNGLQNYDDLYADVLLWAREGWIDYNIPQIYWEWDKQPITKHWLTGGRSIRKPSVVYRSSHEYHSACRSEEPFYQPASTKDGFKRSYQTIGGSCQWYAAAVVENAGKYRDTF